MRTNHSGSQISSVRRIIVPGVLLLAVTPALIVVSGASLTPAGDAASRPELRAPTDPAARGGVPRPNIILILLDDLRFDEWQFMPFVSSKAGNAVLFENAFVSNPLCCPVRSSILSGGFYAKHHRVLNNELPNGSAFAFAPLDSDTIATRLQAGGYATGLIGKYLNRYPVWASQHMGQEIPPGWSTFAGTEDHSNWSDWSVWEGSTGPDARGPGAYVGHISTYPADELTNRALDFIAGPRPFFLMLTHLGPHNPAEPAARDSRRFSVMMTGGGWEYRGRAWGEDVSDKPAWVQQAAQDWWGGDSSRYSPDDPFHEQHVTPDDLVADRLRCLLSIDRGIAAVCDALAAAHLDQDTIVIVMSDNGFLYGEHRLFNKGVPYEESIRVPLIVWGNGLGARNVAGIVAADVDLPVTILDWAGVNPFVGADGRSLAPLLSGAAGRDVFYAQRWPDDEDNTPGWSLLRDATRKFVLYDTDERELFDLATDPFELSNVAGQTDWAETEAAMAAELDALRGLSMKTDALPPAKAHQEYTFALSAWGGVPPYSWSRTSGDLPPGMEFSQTGVLSGTPPRAGSFKLTFRVLDASVSPRHGGPMRVSRTMMLTVTP